MVGANGQILIGRSAYNLFNTIPALSGRSTIMLKPKTVFNLKKVLSDC